MSAAHSSDWLNALPIASCVLRLDNEEIWVALGLRLGGGRDREDDAGAHGEQVRVHLETECHGSAGGEVLAAYGVDVSPAMIELARPAYPDLRFEVTVKMTMKAV